MTNKKSILMICSWLDLSKGIGVFFFNQAVALNDNFSLTLLNFKPLKINFKNINQFNELLKIKYVVTDEGIEVLYISYPVIFKIHFLEKILQRIAIKKVNNYLNTKSISIDLIHAQSLFDAGFFALNYSKIFRIPFIITEHNQLTMKNTNNKRIRLIEKILNTSKRNLVVSDDLVRQFATNGFFQDFLNVGNMVDENIFNTENRINSRFFEIITVGAYTPVKDQITILNALKLIDYPLEKKIRFTWVGINGWGGDFEKEVKKIIEDYNFINIEIVIAKYATSHEIANFLKQSDLFLTSSLCETFGVSVLESLACGVPVITTQSGGINETISLENGRIIRIKDSEAMANHIENIIKGNLIFDKKTISKQIIEKYGLGYFKAKMSSIYKLAIGI